MIGGKLSGQHGEVRTAAGKPAELDTQPFMPTGSETGAHLVPAGDAGSQSACADYSFLGAPLAADELGRVGGYRVLKRLGAGGMGLVFQAEDTQLRRMVALKVMQPRLAADPVARQRFLQEARAAAALRHDGIVTIHQVGEDGGLPFLAMELLPGETLESRLQRSDPLPLAESVRIGREIADALAAAHSQGVVHRDIKPANIWLDAGAGGRVKILDFGLARCIESGDDAQLTHSGVIVGTPAYMSPEQARALKVDRRTDLFSLGVLLYRLCTGEMPFEGNDALSTMLAVTTQQPRPPHSAAPEVPRQLSDLVMKLLSKSPSERPESAQHVVEVLAGLETAPARKPAWLSRQAAADSRRRMRWMIGAVPGIILVACWWTWRPGTRDGDRFTDAANYVESGPVESLLSRSLKDWQSRSGAWRILKQENEQHGVLQGTNGIIQRPLPRREELQDPLHFRLTFAVALQSASAVEIEFGLHDSGSRFVLRITRDGVIGGRRSEDAGQFDPITPLAKTAIAESGVCVVHLERLHARWQLMLTMDGDRTLIGSLPCHETVELPQFRLVVVDGPAQLLECRYQELMYVPEVEAKVD